MGPRMDDKVERWLAGLGLSRYAGVFADNEISYGALPHLTQDDLRELHLPIGPRRIIAAAIDKLPRPAADAVPAGEQTSPRGEGERRHLTVLFCDLVGSTELSTRLDPEDMREVLRAYQETCSRVIARYDGYVAKFMGDGIYAYFGYPRAHEDDAGRAIHAAIDLVAKVRELDTGNKADLALRIGIATGPVVVGDMLGKGASQEAAVTGETPNLAGRLQSLASANAIVISDATWRLAGGMFECVDLGRHALKGFANRVQAWSVRGPRPVESRFDATHAARITELIGRDEEVEILQRRWQRAKVSQGQIVLIAGEPGIGKSRLVRALQDRISDDAHTRLFFQCSPYHTSSALHPMIEQLQRAARFEAADDNAAKLDKLEAVLDLAGCNDVQTAALCASLLSVPSTDRYPALALSPPQQKQRTQDALIRQLVGLAERKPVLFVFEDAHWVDPTTLELLDRTIARLVDLPVLMVITYRPEFAAPWAGGAQVTLLTLNRLSREDRTAMAERVAGGARLPAQVLDQIAARTDGIPLFIEELTKSMLESGLVQAADGSGMGEVSHMVPNTLQAALMARLDRLAGIKNILQVGACIGREFSYSLLAKAASIAEDDLRRALDQFADAELVFRRGDPPTAIYTFKHALVQDAAYSSLLRNRRADIHGTIAAAIESGFPDIVETQPEIVAHHLTEAGLIERAIPMWDRAGRSAARKFANTEAIRHFTRALELTRSLPDGEARDRQELAIHINLGPVYMAAKGFGAPEAGATYARANEVAKAVGDASQRFTCLWGLWIYNVVQPRKGLARSISEGLLTVSAESADSGQELQARHASWTTNFFAGDFKYTREQTQSGRTLYDASVHRSHKFLYGGHDPGVCSGMFGSVSTFILGYPDQALAIMREGWELSRTLNHPLSELMSEQWMAVVLLLRGEAREAAQHMKHAIRVASEGGIPRGMWANFLSGWAMCSDGRAAEGLARALSDFDAVGSAGQEAFRPYYTGVLADMCRAAGRLDDGVALVGKAMTLAETHDSPWCLSELHRIKGELMLARGEPAVTAEACFETALATAREQSAKCWELRAATSLARLRQSQGKPAEARDILAPVYGWFSEGFDSANLKEAKTVLDQLANGGHPSGDSA